VAVNVSEAQLRQPNFVVTVLEAIGSTLSHPSRIDVEITETMLAQNTAATYRNSCVCEKRECKYSWTDFGTGYSGLSQIAHLPLDALQDRPAFIAE